MIRSPKKPKPSKEIILSVLMFVAGVFAGWTNENMGGATMGAVMPLSLIYFKIKKCPSEHIMLPDFSES